MKIVSIGVADRENIDELHLMASDKKFVFNIDDYQQLVEKSQHIMSVICESGKKIYLGINKFFIGSKISKGVFVPLKPDQQCYFKNPFWLL